MSKRVDMDSQPRRIPNPQVQDAAEQFFRACKVLAKLPPGSDAGVLPLLHSAAVALELYLKSLAAGDVHRRGPVGVYKVYASPDARSHKLVKLLEEIPDNIWSQLDGAFKSSAFSRQASSFEDLLGQFEGLFVASRYPFEEAQHIDRYPLDTLLALIHFLDEFVRQLAIQAVRD